jgi:hypothetical protein
VVLLPPTDWEARASGQGSHRSSRSPASSISQRHQSSVAHELASRVGTPGEANACCSPRVVLRRRAVRSAARILQSRTRLSVWIAAAPASALASTSTFTSPGVVAGEVVDRNADQTMGEVDVISSRETDRAVSTGPRYGLGNVLALFTRLPQTPRTPRYKPRSHRRRDHPRRWRGRLSL